MNERISGSAKYTLAGRMSVSGHKSESQHIKYIKCSLDEVAEMVAAANDKERFLKNPKPRMDFQNVVKFRS